MKPDESYLELQRKLRHCIIMKCPFEMIHNVQDQLEKKFMAAWRFGPAHHRDVATLGEFIRNPGFDHCKFYLDEDGRRIVVSQPYNPPYPDIERSLTFDEDCRVEIILAPEWGFHYPVNADLFMVRFSPDFERALDRYKRKIWRLEFEASVTYFSCDPGEPKDPYRWADYENAE